MPSESAPWPIDVFAGTTTTLLARHRHVDGTFAIPANTDIMRVVVKLADAPHTKTYDVSMTDGNTGWDATNERGLFTELQGTPDDPDPRWPLNCPTIDGEGFNFEWHLPASAFPSRGRYIVELTVTRNNTNADVSKTQWEGPARSVIS